MDVGHRPAHPLNHESPVSGAFLSGRRDLNSGPLVPQTSALTRLRHAPRREHRIKPFPPRRASPSPVLGPLRLLATSCLARQRQAPLQVGSRQAPRRGVREPAWVGDVEAGRARRAAAGFSKQQRLLLGFQVPLVDRRCAAPTGGTHRPTLRRAVSRPALLLWPGERRLSPPRRDSEERDVARRPSAARATAPPPTRVSGGIGGVSTVAAQPEAQWALGRCPPPGRVDDAAAPCRQAGCRRLDAALWPQPSAVIGTGRGRV